MATTALADEDRLLVHFALGSLCDRLGRYDEAFEHYRQGNRLKGVRFDAPAFGHRVDRIIAGFGKDRLAHAARSDRPADRPVFVVGMMRSGTSLVEQILSGHSAVFGAGELPDLERCAQAVRAAAPDIGQLTVQQLNTCAGAYLDRINRLNSEARHVVDKMPQNFLHLGYIALMFPGAKIIHCTRNALDTCLSCYFQNFAAFQSQTFDLRALGHYYVEYRRLMQHWIQVLEIPVHEVRYEKLVADPETEIAALLAFCGLEPESALLPLSRKPARGRHREFRPGAQTAVPEFGGALAQLRKTPPPADRYRRAPARRRGMSASRLEALVEQAWTQFEAGRTDQAQHLFQEVIGLDPDNAEAWMMTGLLVGAARRRGPGGAAVAARHRHRPRLPGPLAASGAAPTRRGRPVGGAGQRRKSRRVRRAIRRRLAAARRTRPAQR